MLCYALIFLLAVHGIAHLAGFAVFWRLVASPELPYRTTILHGRLDLGDWGIRLYGVGWLALGACFAAVAVGAALRAPWWLACLVVLTAASLLFCGLGWPEARIGVLANISIIALALAAIRFGGDSSPIRNLALDDLWKAAPRNSGEKFDAAAIASLPAPARRLLEHAMAPETPLASSVRLRMHGEIKLGTWRPFQAEQVITRSGDFVWAATVSAYWLPIRGSDRFVGGEGAMSWKLLNLLTVMEATGPDIGKSAAGRFHGELATWLPSALPSQSVTWAASEPSRVTTRIAGPKEATDIDFEIDERGGVKTVKFSRWGNPGGEYGYSDFGVIVEQERQFGGFTIPSRIRAGWFFGSARFESEGEFFRATIESAEYR